jgi:putative DNA primase/helicase
VVDATKFADEFLKKRGFNLPEGLCLRRYRQDWYQFDGSIFRIVPEDEMRAHITTFLREADLGSKLTMQLVHNVRMNLESVCIIPHGVEWPSRLSESKWVPQPHCVVMRNGILDLSPLRQGTTQLTLAPHTPLLLSRVCLPYEYDSHAKCPRWSKFLESILPEAESRQLVQELFGYCLTYDLSIQKFFLFLGVGGNGKGVTLNILRHLVGRENVSALPLARFNGNHDLIETLGKLVNITNEVGDRLAEDYLKQFVSGDLMYFNPKHKTPFSAKPTAKLVNATNELPHVADRSDGFWRRVIVLPFPVTIPPEQRDPRLEETLVLELGGILNWAIAGARQLNQRGYFMEPPSVQKALHEWRKRTDSAGQYLIDLYEEAQDGEIGRQELYQNYEAWCLENDQRQVSEVEFHRTVELKFPRVTKHRPRKKSGTRPRTYCGIGRKSLHRT